MILAPNDLIIGNIYLVFVPGSWHIAPKTLGIPGVCLFGILMRW